MFRPTPYVAVTEADVAALKKIMQENPKGSTPYKRAAVILGCAEGRRGRDVADMNNVSSTTVTNWRRKFQSGGVEGLMSDAPRHEKRVKDDVPEGDPVKDVSAGTPVDDDYFGGSALAKHLASSNPLLRKALEKLGVIPARRPTEGGVLPDFTDKKVCIVGLFLSVRVQILALAISSDIDQPFFKESQPITINNGLTRSQKFITADFFGLDLTYCLYSLPILIPDLQADWTTEEAADFIQNLKNLLNDTDIQLYLVLHAPKPSSIVKDESLINMSVSSTEEFKKTAFKCFQAIDEISGFDCELSKHISRLLDKAKTQSRPFIWQVTPQQDNQSQSSSSTLANNQLKISISYKDENGERVVSSKVLNNAVPNCGDFAQCNTLDDMRRLVGKLEQGLVKGAQEVKTELMTKAINTESAHAKLKLLKNKKKTNVAFQSYQGKSPR